MPTEEILKTDVNLASMYAQVTFPLSSFRTFTYTIPESMISEILPGTCVITPFRNTERVGYVLSTSSACDYRGEIKSILRTHQEDLSISEELWKTMEWVSRYYITPLGMVLKTAIPLSFIENYQPRMEKYARITEEGIQALPDIPNNYSAQRNILEALFAVDEPVKISSMKHICSSPSVICNKFAEKGYISLSSHPKIYDPFDMMSPGTPQEITLNEEQNEAFVKISAGMEVGKYTPWLLKGVTGSGKTEVYLKLAQQAVDLGKSVMVLVPEIALTPQVARRFRLAFGNRVALWHSAMTRAEKGWTWQQLKKGKYSVVVGARSAVFTPLKNLGLIIVDEEQETSYKQDNPAPRYHARDIALVRGKNAGAAVLLTSATPSLESYYNSLNGRLDELKLTKRYGNAVYPDVKLVDMKLEQRETSNYNLLFSRILIEEINLRLDKKEQIILLQNRRGFAVIQQCLDCGHIEECVDCAVSLTYHSVGHKLLCHYCRKEKPVLEICPVCAGSKLTFSGSGTQKVEDEVHRQFPNAKVVRMDVDSTRGRGKHYKILKTFGDGKADILLGTQMIAKGLDFENVTLVGVINADSGLYLPDFRAGERVFQLIYQVSGRAGRREKKGLAVIQTYNSDDPYIKSAARLDTQKFYNIALAQRNELNYPPFSRLTRILLSGIDRENVLRESNSIKSVLSNNKKLDVLGPAPAPIERIAGKWRFHLIIKTSRQDHGTLHNYLHEKIGLSHLNKPGKGVRVQIDVDPVSLL